MAKERVIVRAESELIDDPIDIGDIEHTIDQMRALPWPLGRAIIALTGSGYALQAQQIATNLAVGAASCANYLGHPKFPDQMRPLVAELCEVAVKAQSAANTAGVHCHTLYTSVKIDAAGQPRSEGEQAHMLSILRSAEADLHAAVRYGDEGVALMERIRDEFGLLKQLFEGQE